MDNQPLGLPQRLDPMAMERCWQNKGRPGWSLTPPKIHSTTLATTGDPCGAGF